MSLCLSVCLSMSLSLSAPPPSLYPNPTPPFPANCHLASPGTSRCFAFPPALLISSGRLRNRSWGQGGKLIYVDIKVRFIKRRGRRGPIPAAVHLVTEPCETLIKQGRPIVRLNPAPAVFSLAVGGCAAHRGE